MLVLRRALLTLPVLAASAAARQRSALRRRLDELTAQLQRETGGEAWWYARHLESGREEAHRPDERVRTASTIKLPIMAAAFDLAARGELRWDERLTLRREDIVSGSGVLREFTPGESFRVDDLVRLMIVVSDNTCTNLVLDRIGGDTVNAFLDRIGLPRTRTLRKIRGDGTQLKAATGWSAAGRLEENQRFGIGVSTPREMARLMELLHTGKLVNAEASAAMLAILRRQQYKDGIGRRLGPGASVASKSGALDALRSDVALVTTKAGAFAIAITVDGMKQVDYSEDNAGSIMIAEMAKAIVGGLASQGATQ
jgi:beta-lactamase class A